FPLFLCPLLLSFIRKSRSTSSISAKIIYDDSSNTNPVDAANLFSMFSSSIYTPSRFSDSLSSNIKLPQFILPSNPNFILDDVSKSLCSLRNIKSVGPDGLQGHFQFMLRDFIAWPLFLIFLYWGESLGHSLNISKCSVFSFNLSQSHFNFPYVIHNIPIKPNSDSSHDIVLRSSSEFQLASPFKALYCALVRPLLEYGSVLWDPSTACVSSSIERVHRKFLRIAAYRLNIPHPPHDYSPVLRVLNLSSLADRRHVSNLHFFLNFFRLKLILLFSYP
ncbi:Reverse transcriptase domain-containing protein, partial [Aphis craccivora]